MGTCSSTLAGVIREKSRAAAFSSLSTVLPWMRRMPYLRGRDFSLKFLRTHSGIFVAWQAPLCSGWDLKYGQLWHWTISCADKKHFEDWPPKYWRSHLCSDFEDRHLLGLGRLPHSLSSPFHLLKIGHPSIFLKLNLGQLKVIGTMPPKNWTLKTGQQVCRTVWLDSPALSWKKALFI